MRPATAAAFLALALAAGCAPRTTVHGFAPQQAELERIAIGQDTRSSVLQKLGQPSAVGTFTNDEWYYVASRMERHMFYAPQVVDRTVVAVRFDPAGAVADVARYGLEDGRVVNLATRTTPTFGRELTVLQQLFGNIGNVGSEQLLSPGVPSRTP